MFGYVKPVPKELLVKEYEFYKATYCGICRAMKKHTGSLSNATLSYDSVMLALVRMMFVTDGEISSHMRRCIAHPLKKRCMLVENPAIEYTARAFAILAYHKLLDDIKDEGLGKRILIAPAHPVLRAASKKAGYSDIADIVKDRLDRISELVIYNWNRRYPSDTRLDIDPAKDGFRMLTLTEFKGNAHERITKEVYVK